MAKTMAEKLISVLESAVTLRNDAAAGNQKDQFAQETIDALSAAIEEAHKVSVSENVDDEQLESALKLVSEAIKAFKSEAKRLSDEAEAAEAKEDADKKAAEESEKNAAKKISLKGVVLKGSHPQKKGNHSVHLGATIVTFINGEANVSEATAKELKKTGYVE
jgi:hypothetical protein